MENMKLQNPLVSIIIPTFNRAYILNRALNSIFSQTIQDWEIIIVDDGSTDNIVDFIKKIQEKEKRLYFFKLDKNRGPSAARNIGLQNAKGRYIAFLDSDDEWLPDKLEKQLFVFEKGDENLGLVYTGAKFINEKKKETRIKKVKDKGDIYIKEISYNPVGGPSRVMIKSECIEKSDTFDENLFSVEDWDLWIRISQNYKVDFVDLPLVNYFESDDSISINSSNVIKGYNNLWEKHDILSKDKSIVAFQYCRLGHRLCYYGDYSVGRSYLWKAVATHPYNLKNIFLYFLSIFGSKIYRKTTFIIMKNI